MVKFRQLQVRVRAMHGVKCVFSFAKSGLIKTLKLTKDFNHENTVVSKAITALKFVSILKILPATGSRLTWGSVAARMTV